MRIGIFAPFVSGYSSPTFFLQGARAAEDLGFHSMWVPEHVILFDDYQSQYPYRDDGRVPGGAQASILDPFSYLAFLAAGTSTIRLGTGICLVPQRNPVYTAKEAASVDYLSGGRLDLGVGIGWLAEEFAALDVPWPKRAQRTRSYLAVMKSLWCDEVSSYNDEFYDLPPSRQHPKPVQQPHPPIHFGGESDAALKRTADLGQGWFGYNLTPDAARERIGYLSGLLEARGRSLSDIYISAAPNIRGVDAAMVQEYEAAGVQQVIIAGWGRDPDAYLESLARLSDEFVKPAANLAAAR